MTFSIHELLFLWPPVRRRWNAYMADMYPILHPAFPEDARAQMIALRCLDRVHAGDDARSLKLLHRLAPLCKTDADHALWHFLSALQLIHCPPAGKAVDDAIIGELRTAEKCGHDYHWPHALLGSFYLREQSNPTDALPQFDRAIDCVYAYPPLNDEKRCVIAQMHALRAIALHQLDRRTEAEDALRLAAFAEDSEEYGEARHLLHPDKE